MVDRDQDGREAMTTRIKIINDEQAGQGAFVRVKRNGYPDTDIGPGESREFYVWLGGTNHLGDITGISEKPPALRPEPPK
jgi:hypothetical protein